VRYSVVISLTITLMGWITVESRAEDTPAAVFEKMKSYDKVYTASLTVRGTVIQPPPFNAPNDPRLKNELVFTRSGRRQALIQTGIDLPLKYKPKKVVPGKENHPEGADGIPYDKDGNAVLAYLTGETLSFEDDRSAALSVSTAFVVGPGDKVSRAVDNRTITFYNHDAPNLMPSIQTLLWALGRGFTPYLDEIKDVRQEEDGTLTVSGPGSFDTRQYRGRWVLVVDPKAQYLVRRAEFFAPAEAKDPFLVASNTDVKIEGPCVYPTTGECDLRLGGTGPRVYTFREVKFATEDEVLTKARRATEETDVPRTMVEDYRLSPPKSVYTDQFGRKPSEEAQQKESPPPVPRSPRKLWLVIICNVLLFGTLAVLYFRRKKAHAPN
jgi:hypothetical protein